MEQGIHLFQICSPPNPENMLFITLIGNLFSPFSKSGKKLKKFWEVNNPLVEGNSIDQLCMALKNILSVLSPSKAIPLAGLDFKYEKKKEPKLSHYSKSNPPVSLPAPSEDSLTMPSKRCSSMLFIPACDM